MNRYILLLIICFLLTLPLEFVFKPRIYSKPIILAKSIWLPMLTYLVWDYFATKNSHWEFNNTHIVGLKLFSIPVEEYLFFIIIPICALLTYGSISNMLKSKKQSKIVSIISIFAFTLCGALMYLLRISNGNLNVPTRTFPYYTLLTSLLCLGLFFYYRKDINAKALISSNIYFSTIAICLFFMLIVNGLLTMLNDPAVIYHANLGPRLYLDIPFEDFFYGLALITWVLIRFNKLINVNSSKDLSK